MMILVLFFVFSLLFSLGVWESVATFHAKRSHGDSYNRELPRTFFMPTFQVLKLMGQSGVIIVPWIAWSHGPLWAIGLGIALFIVGGAIGCAIPAAIEAGVRREEQRH